MSDINIGQRNGSQSSDETPSKEYNVFVHKYQSLQATILEKYGANSKEYQEFQNTYSQAGLAWQSGSVDKIVALTKQITDLANGTTTPVTPIKPSVSTIIKKATKLLSNAKKIKAAIVNQINSFSSKITSLEAQQAALGASYNKYKSEYDSNPSKYPEAGKILSNILSILSSNEKYLSQLQIMKSGSTGQLQDIQSEYNNIKTLANNIVEGASADITTLTKEISKFKIDAATYTNVNATSMLSDVKNSLSTANISLAALKKIMSNTSPSNANAIKIANEALQNADDTDTNVTNQINGINSQITSLEAQQAALGASYNKYKSEYDSNPSKYPEAGKILSNILSILSSNEKYLSQLQMAKSVYEGQLQIIQNDYANIKTLATAIIKGTSTDTATLTKEMIKFNIDAAPVTSASITSMLKAVTNSLSTANISLAALKKAMSDVVPPVISYTWSDLQNAYTDAIEKFPNLADQLNIIYTTTSNNPADIKKAIDAINALTSSQPTTQYTKKQFRGDFNKLLSMFPSAAYPDLYQQLSVLFADTPDNASDRIATIKNMKALINKTFTPSTLKALKILASATDAKTANIDDNLKKISDQITSLTTLEQNLSSEYTAYSDMYASNPIKFSGAKQILTEMNNQLSVIKSDLTNLTTMQSNITTQLTPIQTEYTNIQALSSAVISGSSNDITTLSNDVAKFTSDSGKLTAFTNLNSVLQNNESAMSALQTLSNSLVQSIPNITSYTPTTASELDYDYTQFSNNLQNELNTGAISNSQHDNLFAVLEANYNLASTVLSAKSSTDITVPYTIMQVASGLDSGLSADVKSAVGCIITANTDKSMKSQEIDKINSFINSLNIKEKVLTTEYNYYAQYASQYPLAAGALAQIKSELNKINDQTLQLMSTKNSFDKEVDSMNASYSDLVNSVSSMISNNGGSISSIKAKLAEFETSLNAVDPSTIKNNISILSATLKTIPFSTIETNMPGVTKFSDLAQKGGGYFDMGSFNVGTFITNGKLNITELNTYLNSLFTQMSSSGMNQIDIAFSQMSSIDDMSPDGINVGDLTTPNTADALLNSVFSQLNSADRSNFLSDFTKQAHNNNIKVDLSIGGEDAAGNTICGKGETGIGQADKLAFFMNKFGIDSVDFDIENQFFTIANLYGADGKTFDQAKINDTRNFFEELKSKLNAVGKTSTVTLEGGIADWPGKPDETSGGLVRPLFYDENGNKIFNKMFDSVNLMLYGEATYYIDANPSTCGKSWSIEQWLDIIGKNNASKINIGFEDGVPYANPIASAGKKYTFPPGTTNGGAAAIIFNDVKAQLEKDGYSSNLGNPFWWPQRYIDGDLGDRYGVYTNDGKSDQASWTSTEMQNFWNQMQITAGEAHTK